MNKCEEGVSIAFLDNYEVKYLRNCLTKLPTNYMKRFLK